jgi:hypothetical protein
MAPLGQTFRAAQTKFVIGEQSIDINHGYAKAPVVNSKLEKRWAILAKRLAHVQRLAAQSRQRLVQMQACNQLREELVLRWEQRQPEVLAQVRALETMSPADEPRRLALKAQHVEAEWEVHHRRILQDCHQRD